MIIEEKEKSIKIFVACHKPSFVPQHPLLVPIQVGTALSSELMEGYLHDNTGDNISDLNRSYCELTAQYWAWKNVDASYYGFFHYRRFLYPTPTEKRPYRLEEKPTISTLLKLGFDSYSELIKQYDLILPIGEDMGMSVRDYYKKARFHHIEHLLVIEEIINEKYPEYCYAMNKYLSGATNYFGNIFIMQKEVFFHYCSWLFSILKEFDNRVDLKGYSAQELRVDGYLGERLMGIYYTHWKEKLRTIELPGVYFGLQGKGRGILYHLLPPNTKRRVLFRKLYYSLKN